jgi:UDP-glucose 4-epimerase
MAIEQLLFEATEIESVAMRISNAYGPGQLKGNGFGVIAHWLASAAEGKPLRMYGDSNTTRDFVYIDDVCDAFLRILSSDDPPSVVNIGSGVPTSLAELAEIITDTVDGVDILHEPDRGFDVARTWLDVSRAKTALGWEPQVQLREGISRTWGVLSATP